MKDALICLLVFIIWAICIFQTKPDGLGFIFITILAFTSVAILSKKNANKR